MRDLLSYSMLAWNRIAYSSVIVMLFAVVPIFALANNGTVPPLSTTMSGILTPSSPSCTITSEQNSCNINFSWTTTNPINTSAVIKPVNIIVAEGNSGSDVPFLVKHDSEIFYLYNDAILLDQETVTSSCALDTVWNGSMCVAAPQPSPVVSPSPSPADSNTSGDGDSGGGSSRSDGRSSRSGGSSRAGDSFPGVVLSASISPSPSLECFYLRDYMRRDFNNDSIEVLKLQAFLINFEGHNNVTLTGVFDQATFDAVSLFQMKYFSDILEPWGHTGPTGYAYILTLKKINEIYCQRIFPLNQDQLNEIVAFMAILRSLGGEGGDEIGGIGGGEDEEIVGKIESSKRQNLFRNLAAAVFAPPETLLDTVKCLYWAILILVVLYIVSNVFRSILYKNTPENNRKRFLVKWFTINVGLIVAIVVALTLGWLCLILPFLVAIMLSLIWTISYPEHHSMRASVKSWYLVSLARGKSMLKETKETPKSSPVPFKEEPIRWNIKKESAPDVIFIEPKSGPKIEPKK